MDGEHPLRYVDMDDADLNEYPALAEAAHGGSRIPLVLVGDEVKMPASISIYWIEDQLGTLGVEPFAASAAKGGN
jgi:hypothetical protein